MRLAGQPVEELVDNLEVFIIVLLFLFLLTLAVGVAHKLVNKTRQDSVHHAKDELPDALLLRWWLLVRQIHEEIVVAFKQFVDLADRNFFVPWRILKLDQIRLGHQQLLPFQELAHRLYPKCRVRPQVEVVYKLLTGSYLRF